MNTRTTIPLLMLTSVLTASLMSACGAKTDSAAVTETGNPSLIDKTRITMIPLDGVLSIKGKNDAVPSKARVTVTNQRTNEKQSTTATSDGSFALEIDGDPGDRIEFEVESDGQRDTLKLTVEASNNGTDASSTGTTTADPSTAATAAPPPTASTSVPLPDESIDRPTDNTDAPTDNTNVATDDTNAPTDNTGVPISTVPNLHRTTHNVCDSERPPGDVNDSTSAIDGECRHDVDCQAGAQGRCINNRDYTFCTYDECTQDDECPLGPCACDGGLGAANKCLDGNCKVNADCGEEGYCSPSQSTCGSYSGVVGYWCHTPEDECLNDGDCTAEGGGGYCMYSTEVSRWLCSYSQCVG